MRFLPLSFLVVFIPSLVFAQAGSEPVGIETSSVVINSGEKPSQNFQLVTPVLQRTIANSNEPWNDESAYSQHSAVPFFSSLIIPGTGQMMNRNWWRSGLYLALEAVSIYATFEYRSRGQRGERRYESFADDNWSVVQYSNWLVIYHDIHNIDNPYINELRDMLNGTGPAFSTRQDWEAVDINLLRNVERNTPYLTTDNLPASNFSHTLPEYGSQQYYELISKYYQYQAGWRDYDQFHNNLGHTNGLFYERYLVDRNGAYASDMFYNGVDMSYRFNQDFRISNHFLSLLIVNHVVSAFDAYFTVKVKQNRVRATSSMLPGRQVVIHYNF